MNVARVKDVTNINRWVLPEDTNPSAEFFYIDISGVDSGGNITVPAETVQFSGAPSRARRIAPAGSTVISTVRTYLKAIAHVKPDSRDRVFSTGFAVLEARKGLDERYLSYFARSNPFVDELVSRSVGVSYPAVNASDVGDIPIELPPLEEQRRIADFLDAETSRIDQVTERRNDQKRLVVERMRSVLADGLLAPSDDAKRGRIKNLFRWQRGGVWGGDPQHDNKDSVCVRVADFDRRTLLAGADAPTLRAIPDTQRAGRQLIPGDVILEKSGGGDSSPVGFAVSYDGQEGVRAVCSNFTALLRPRVEVNSRYAALLLGACYLTGQNAFYIKQTTGIQNLDMSAYLAHRVSIAPRDQQDRIVAKGERELTQASNLVNAADRQLELLAERKQALITAAVTGQIDVTTAGRATADLRA